MIIEGVFELERETVNKVRYKVKDDTLGVNEIYIAKTKLTRPFPETITVKVTIE